MDNLRSKNVQDHRQAYPIKSWEDKLDWVYSKAFYMETFCLENERS